jgi:hypothetical protein
MGIGLIRIQKDEPRAALAAFRNALALNPFLKERFSLIPERSASRQFVCGARAVALLLSKQIERFAGHVATRPVREKIDCEHRGNVNRKANHGKVAKSAFECHAPMH